MPDASKGNVAGANETEPLNGLAATRESSRGKAAGAALGTRSALGEPRRKAGRQCLPTLPRLAARTATKAGGRPCGSFLGPDSRAAANVRRAAASRCCHRPFLPRAWTSSLGGAQAEELALNSAPLRSASTPSQFPGPSGD